MNYKLVYDRLITKAKQKTNTGYVERHHILPKSLYPHLKDDPDNIVELTAKEHFIAHLLLAKIYGGKMVFAAYSMSNNRRYTSKSYVWLREEAANFLSETRRGAGNPMFGKTIPEESVKKRAKARTGVESKLKGRNISNETKEKIRSSMSGEDNHFFGKKHTEETKEKIRLKKIGKPSNRKNYIVSDETKEKIRLKNIGKIVSDDTKKKISNTLKGVAKKPFTDEHKQKLLEALHRRPNSLHHLTDEEKRLRANSMENERVRLQRQNETEEQREARRARAREKYKKKKLDR